jgi:hypothetical protein
MKTGYTKKVNLTLGVPFLMGPMMVALLILKPEILFYRWLIVSLVVFAQVFFILGCCLYAKGKGHHPALGLLGLLSLPGLIILAFFPDKHKGEDENKGCLFTLLILVVAMGIIFGSILWLISRAFSSNNTAEHQRKISEDLINIDSRMLSSSDMSLSIRIRSMDNMIKVGEPGLSQLGSVLSTLKSNTAPTKDDEIVIRSIETSLIVLSSSLAVVSVHVSTSDPSPLLSHFQVSNSVEIL